VAIWHQRWDGAGDAIVKTASQSDQGIGVDLI
jgi:hypothetical protein